MLHDVGNNRDCDVDVDHRNNTKCVCANRILLEYLSSLKWLAMEHMARCSRYKIVLLFFWVSKMFPDFLQVLEEQNPVDQSKQDLRMWTILPGGNLWITQNHLASRVDWLDQSN